VGPLIFALLGLGGAGLLVKFEPYRPYFIAPAVAVAFRWTSPAFACGGACSTDALGGLSFLAVAVGVVLAASRAASFIRQRHTTRAFEEGGT
jgi:hypothetical protein